MKSNEYKAIYAAAILTPIIKNNFSMLSDRFFRYIMLHYVNIY